MPLSDYIPNIIGAPTGYEGLLGADPTKKLEKQANLQGLLGVAASLAQGMSSQGPRRSALQNILGSLSSGYGATQQAYQGGLQQYGQQQQIAQANRAMVLQQQKDAVMQKLQRGEQLTQNDYAILNPEEAAKVQFQKMRMADLYKPTVTVPQQEFAQVSPIDQAALLTGAAPRNALPTINVTPEVSDTQRKIDMLRQASLRAATEIGGVEGEKAVAINEKLIKDLLAKQTKESISTYDLTDLEKGVDPKLKPFVTQLKAQISEGQLTPVELQRGVENIQNKQLELISRNRFANETARDYANSQFGTDDMTQLSAGQRSNVLAFVNAPSAKDQATIANDAIRLRQETGQAGVVPVGRGQFISGGQQVGAKPTSAVKPVGQAAVVEAPAVVPGAGKIKEVVPLIEMSDRVVPPAKKQQLILAQPATQALVSYSLDNISQQKKAAEELLNNPAYIKAITAKGLISGVATSALAEQPGTTAYNANQLMKNLQTRAFVSEIQKMRTASPTGGAVGNVTEKEMEGLSNIGASLKLGMSEQEFVRQLKKYISNADRALKEIPNQYSKTYRYAGEFDQYLGGGLPAGVTVEVAQ